ncbi:RepB family plasmid replication initiator protein [Lactobacillus delbrueckii]|nr:RepB family plasmid replication initiator protein [Lactobacillus delbrueckii]MBO1197723.1 RepB family plasmid replication initiator protein [Lactobacillus delbrueckii subsp. lactis]
MVSYTAYKSGIQYVISSEAEGGKMVINETFSKVQHLLIASWYSQPDRASNFRIQLTFKEVSEALGVSRSQATALRNQLRTLTVTLATTTFITSNKDSVHVINLFTEADYSKGKLTFFLNPKMAEAFLSEESSTEYFPLSLLKLKGTAYYLALKVMHNANINARWRADRIDRLGLEDTLKALPTLPDPVENAQGTSRHLQRQIIAPLTKAIEELEAVTGIAVRPSQPLKGLKAKDLSKVTLNVIDWGQVDIVELTRKKRKRLRKNNVRED